MGHTKKRWGSFVLFLIFFLNELAITFLVVPQDWIERLHHSELRMMRSQMGEESLKKGIQNTDSYFQKLFLDSGVYEASLWYIKGSRGDVKNWKDGGLRSWYKKRVKIFWIVMWHMLFRIFLFIIWLPCIIFFIIPLVIDAIIQREIKKYSFAYSSPLINQQANTMIKKIFLLIFLLPLLPLPIPPVSMPLMFGLLSISFWFLISNMQKRT